MIEMAKCQCGGWLSIEILREYGATMEVCDACGYRQPLRSRAVIEEPIALHVDDRRGGRPCAWPTGCDQFARSPKTDLCPTHCGERRKLLNRAYAKGRTDIRKLQRASLRVLPSH